MGAVAGLVAGDLDAVVEPVLQHRRPERLRAVRVRPLADHQHRRVLPERHRLVERRHARLRPRPPDRRAEVAHRPHDLPDVLAGRAAAAADQPGAEVAHEPDQRFRQLLRRQRVDRPVRTQSREARVRHHRQRDPGVLGELPQVFAHLGGSGRAVQPDQVDPERFQRRQRGPDLRAEQHRAGRLDRHLGDDRHRPAVRRHRPLGPDDRRLGLQQVLRGLHDDRVHTTREQAFHLLHVRVAQPRERRVPQRRQLRAGPDRPEHEPRPPRFGELVGHLAGQRTAHSGQFEDPVGDAVVGQVGQVGPERVGLDGVGPRLQVGPVHTPHHVRPGDVQDLVATLVTCEVVQREVHGLEHRAHRPVGDDHTIFERGQQR